MSKKVKIEDFKNDKTILEGIAVYLLTWNNEKEIKSCLTSILNTGYDQIVMCDGSSDDNTVKIARQFDIQIIKTAKGIAIQRAAVLKLIKYKYVISIEADHIFPPNFCKIMLENFKETNFVAMQARLRCIEKNNYLERGFAVFYEIHNDSPGKVDAIGGPTITYYKFLENYFSSTKIQGAGADTERSEILKKLNLNVGLADIIAYQNEKMDVFIFFKKYFWYGIGDYDFYKTFSKGWPFSRKIKSVTHIFIKYIVKYPFIAILKRRAIYIPYFWMLALVRYCGWISKIISK